MMLPGRYSNNWGNNPITAKSVEYVVKQYVKAFKRMPEKAYCNADDFQDFQNAIREVGFKITLKVDPNIRSWYARLDLEVEI